MTEFDPIRSFEDPHTPLLSKWLKLLFWAQCAVLAASLAGMLRIPLLPWIGRAGSLAAGVSLLMLSGVSPRYRKGGIVQLVALGLQLSSLLLSKVSVLVALPAAVLSIVGIYQEYHGHADVTAAPLPKLSRRWHNLFNAYIIITVLSSFFAPVLSVLAVLMGVDAEKITNAVTVLMTIPGVIVQVLYLLCLHKTRSCFQG